MLLLERINRIINYLLTWRKKTEITYKINKKRKMNIKMEEIWNIIWNYISEIYKSENQGEIDNFLAKYKWSKVTPGAVETLKILDDHKGTRKVKTYRW